MNKEDKERFARYRKGYIAPENEDENTLDILDKKKKTQMGFIDNIEVKVNNLVKDIIDTKAISKKT